MNLYELTEEWQDAKAAMEVQDYDEQIIIDTLSGIECEIEDKADNYAKIIKMFEGDIETFKIEESRLAMKRKAIENRIKWLKAGLENAMLVLDRKKIKTLLFDFTIQKNPPSLKLADEFFEWAKENRDDFLRYKEPELDRKVILDALKGGEIIEGAEIVQSEGLRIK